MNGYYDQVKAVLIKHGFVLFRQGKGSHQIWKNDNNNLTVAVSTNCKSRHTANQIMKEAKINHKL